jgi:HTH-type transcriptional regulator/antitoxin HigA
VEILRSVQTVKLIKSVTEYEAALEEVEALIDLDPIPGSADANRLEVLALLVEEYESKEFSLSAPNPTEAIRFRMEQQGLTARDLIPYLGSRAKVSEVLSGKRELTLAMIRALHSGLGIPASSLISATSSEEIVGSGVEWSKFPVREMAARGWIEATTTDLRNRADELAQGFFARIGYSRLAPVLYRKSDHVRSARRMDPYALVAWGARILMIAESDLPSNRFEPGALTRDFMRRLAGLSVHSKGPAEARQMLNEHGIVLVAEPHLPRTHLDGAAMMTSGGVPVIGLTLRYDRLDNFWFTLLHEVAHVARHLTGGECRFFDDLNTESGDDEREIEADILAGEALIPTSSWARSPARLIPSPDAVFHLAAEVGVHPSIVAGRIQHDAKNFKILHHLVGRGEVRKWFDPAKWHS